MLSAPAVATAPGGIMDKPGAPAPGLDLLNAVRILNQAGGALWVQALLHGQLAQVEWEEEKNRLLKMLALTLLGFACLLSAALFAGGLLLAAAWDTAYRIPAGAGLTLLYGFGAAVAWRRFQALSELGRGSFAASREELAADAALLEARS
jgi:uncharacterized membrane protein YqjE